MATRTICFSHGAPAELVWVADRDVVVREVTVIAEGIGDFIFSTITDYMNTNFQTGVLTDAIAIFSFNQLDVASLRNLNFPVLAGGEVFVANDASYSACMVVEDVISAE